MLTDSESRVVGPLVVAFGTAFFAAGLARILWPAADGMIYLASLGIGFGFPLFAAGLWSIRADMLRTGVDLEERRARLQPAVEPEPPAPVVVAEVIPDHTGAWRLAVETFLLAGDVRGFSARKMAGVVGSDGWPVLKGWLIEHEILADVTGRGTVWAENVTLASALTRLRSGSLPYPDGLPPRVEMSVNTPATRNAATRDATAQQA